MTRLQIALIAVAVVFFLGIIVFPLINRRQFSKLPYEQKIRILMKEASSLVYFKNVSQGSSGTLYYVKNKRKILILPWVLSDGNMVITKANPFSNWDYPEQKEKLTEDELQQLLSELEKQNKKSPVKIIFK
jgi:hypothetical protein